MGCYYPVKAWRSEDGGVVFNQLRRSRPGDAIELPCGQCIGCRLERSRQWGVRCLHETQLWQRNCFVTLTYSDAHLPEGSSLRYVDYQLFMKRLRRAGLSERVRFFMCGEYGERYKRPHYHAILFNVDFDDRRLVSAPGPEALYDSSVLTGLWGLGGCKVGDATFKSACYVARYITDKITGEDAAEHYEGREPEFCHMSLKPGIGFEWYRRFKSDVYPSGKVVVNGKECFPPRYYDKLYKRDSELDREELSARREFEAYPFRGDRTPARLEDRAVVARARLGRFGKKLDGGV